MFALMAACLHATTFSPEEQKALKAEDFHVQPLTQNYYILF